MTSPLDDASLATLHGRSLLLTQDWSTRDLDTLLGLAARLEALDRAGKRTEVAVDASGQAPAVTTRPVAADS